MVSGEDKLFVGEDTLKKLKEHNTLVSFLYIELGKIEEKAQTLRTQKEQVLKKLRESKQEAEQFTVVESERLGLSGVDWTVKWDSGEVVKLK